MTSVSFYFNVPDKHVLLAQLLQKALHQHRKATVFVESEQVATELTKILWSGDDASFLANAVAHDAHANVTPIIIDWQAHSVFQDDVLVNFQSKQLTFFSRFKQLIELVGLDEADKAEARQRFAFYRDRGYAIKPVDMLKKSI
jgi:DNA polymerase III subunit chi